MGSVMLRVAARASQETAIAPANRAGRGEWEPKLARAWHYQPPDRLGARGAGAGEPQERVFANLADAGQAERRLPRQIERLPHAATR